MAEMDRLEREVRRFAGRDLMPIAKEAVVEGKTAPDMQIWINALKECVRHRFLTPNEAVWFKERVLRDCYRPDIKRHLSEKLLSEDITALFGALTNVKGIVEGNTGILEIIYSCEDISDGADIGEINKKCSDCGKRIKDIGRIAQNKLPLCPIMNLSSLIDSSIADVVKPANPFEYVVRYPVDYIDVWEKEMIRRIDAFKRAYMTHPYTNFMYYRHLFGFREVTKLGRRISDMRNKVVKISKKMMKFGEKLESTTSPRRRGLLRRLFRRRSK